MKLNEIIGDNTMDACLVLFAIAFFVTDQQLISVGCAALATYLGGLFEVNPICKKILACIEWVTDR